MLAYENLCYRRFDWLWIEESHSIFFSFIIKIDIFEVVWIKRKKKKFLLHMVFKIERRRKKKWEKRTEHCNTYIGMTWFAQIGCLLTGWENGIEIEWTKRKLHLLVMLFALLHRTNIRFRPIRFETKLKREPKFCRFIFSIFFVCVHVASQVSFNFSSIQKPWAMTAAKRKKMTHMVEKFDYGNES